MDDEFVKMGLERNICDNRFDDIGAAFDIIVVDLSESINV